MKHILPITVLLLLALVAGYLFGVREHTIAPSRDEVAVPTDTAVETQTETPPKTQGQVIDLAGQGLTQVSPGVFAQSGATELDLSHNALSGALPAEVRQLTDLRVLDLSYNNFTGVPAEVGQLSKLEVLDLSHNPITGLPYEIGNLGNLKVLNLEGTNYAPQDLEVIKQSLPVDTEIRL